MTKPLHKDNNYYLKSYEQAYGKENHISQGIKGIKVGDMVLPAIREGKASANQNPLFGIVCDMYAPVCHESLYRNKDADRALLDERLGSLAVVCWFPGVKAFAKETYFMCHYENNLTLVTTRKI